MTIEPIKTMNESNLYKIILADDHEVLRIGLRTLITSNPDYIIVGEVNSGEKILSLLNVVACDLIILDLWMPDINGFEVLSELAEKHPHVKRLILSMDNSPETVRKALSRGVDGFITKEDLATNIKSAIETIRGNKKFFSAEVQQFIIENYDSMQEEQNRLQGITEREKEVTGLIATGLTNKEIGSLLSISAYTVQFHRSNVMRKLNLKSMADLIKFAMENDLCSYSRTV